MIEICFEDTFDFASINADFSEITFYSPQVDGTNELLLVKIARHPDPLLPNVYNLGFGPPDEKGGFCDDVRLRHADNSRVLSTVLFHGFLFLQINPRLTLGIDGSDDLRATMYHLMIKSNRAYLDKYFILIGVDWYVRIYRDWRYEMNDRGEALAKPKPEFFDHQRSRHDLYRYCMFRLNE